MKKRFFVGFAMVPSREGGHDFSFCIVDLKERVLTPHDRHTSLAKDLLDRVGKNTGATTYTLPTGFKIESKLEEFKTENIRLFEFYLDGERKERDLLGKNLRERRQTLPMNMHAQAMAA